MLWFWYLWYAERLTWSDGSRWARPHMPMLLNGDRMLRFYVSSNNIYALWHFKRLNVCTPDRDRNCRLLGEMREDVAGEWLRWMTFIFHNLTLEWSKSHMICCMSMYTFVSIDHLFNLHHHTCLVSCCIFHDQILARYWECFVWQYAETFLLAFAASSSEWLRHVHLIFQDR